MQKTLYVRTLLWLFALSLGMSPALQAQKRDPLKWPFAKTSIWNVPIHNNAVYAPAQIQEASNFVPDEDVVIFKPSSPLLPVETNYAGWSQNADRCPDEGPTLFSAPIPANWIYDKTVWEGLTPNAGAAILLPNGKIQQTQPFAKCGTTYATSQFVWSADDCLLTGECITGAHGGSGLSAIGGTIRVGEFSSGEIKHVIKINLWGRENFFHDANGGFRWPAYKEDGGYNSPNEGNYYGGTNPEMKIGALLALHKDLNLSSLANNTLGLETEAGLILARTLQNYGGYTVDNTAWDAYHFITEIGPDGSVRDEFKDLYGYDISVFGGLDNSAWGRDLKRLFSNLQVITNNTQGNPGGGPVSDLTNRRAPAAPDFLPAQTFKIMPLGDSKTEGGGGNGQQSSWRGFLRTKMLQAGYNIDYVGPRQNYADGDTEPYDYDHAGFGGYTIGPDTQRFCETCETTGIYEHIQNWLPAANPDVVLLSIGVNDMFGDNNHPPGYRASAPQRYQDLVNKILGLKPGVRLILGTIEPVKWDKNWGSNPNDQSLGALNAKIREIANASATDNIFLADVYSKNYATWDPGDFWDDLHLSQQGAAKSANTWFASLVPVLNDYPANLPPTVVLSAPANNATFAAPASITLEATANDSDGSVTKVEFFSNNVKIGEDTSAPFSFVWQNVDEGTYLLQALATDNFFATATSAVDTVRVTSTDGYVQLGGTGIGSPGSYANSGATFDKALDGDVNTFFDGPVASGQWVGLDLGVAKVAKKVRVVPRKNWALRIVDARIQGANAADFSDAVDLYTFSAVPIEGIYTTGRFDNSRLFRYYRFLSPGNGYGNVAEIEFWGDPDGPVSQPPVVELTAPANNTNYTPGSDISLTATASDPDGSIAMVEFYADTTLIGTTTASPYSFIWTNVAEGTYLLRAKATDNAGVTKTSEPVSVSVSTGGANVLYAENFNSNTAVGWVANGGAWAAKSQKYESTDWNGEFTSFYGSASFTNYTFSADAIAFWNNDIGFLFNYQDVNNYYVLVINTNSKTATLKKKVGGTLTTVASGTLTGGGTGVSHHVDIRNSGTSTTVWINGEMVFDNLSTPEFSSGKIGFYSFYCPSNFDNVRVISNNALSTVAITSPSNNATFTAPATIEIQATATDPDGAVSQVDFYNGTTLIGTANAAPYAFSWTNVAAGAYDLTAKATDSDGAVTTSSVVRITVTNGGSVEESVAFLNPPLVVNPGETYSVDISYTAAADRFIDLYLFDAQWQPIASKNVYVAAGSGTQPVSITIPADATPITGGNWAVNLWAGDWSSIKKSSLVSGVQINAATAGKLTLTSMCSANPSQTRRWRVVSTYTYPVDYHWTVYGTSQTGTLSVPAQGTVYFETATVAGPNTTIITYGTNGKETKASGGQACSARESFEGADEGSTSVTVHPNPVARVLTVTYFSPEAQAAHLTLVNLLGQTKMSKTEKAVTGANSSELNVESLPNGLYLINVVVGKQKVVKKVLIQHE